nr:hypothetical protein CFP56_63497 [Quercus suber]
MKAPGNTVQQGPKTRSVPREFGADISSVEDVSNGQRARPWVKDKLRTPSLTRSPVTNADKPWQPDYKCLAMPDDSTHDKRGQERILPGGTPLHESSATAAQHHETPDPKCTTEPQSQPPTPRLTPRSLAPVPRTDTLPDAPGLDANKAQKRRGVLEHKEVTSHVPQAGLTSVEMERESIQWRSQRLTKQSETTPRQSPPVFLVPGTPASRSPKWLRRGSHQWSGPLPTGLDQSGTGSSRGSGAAPTTKSELPASSTAQVNERQKHKRSGDRSLSPAPSLMSDCSSTTSASSIGSRSRTKRRRSSQMRLHTSPSGAPFVCDHPQHAAGTYKPAPS